MNLGTSDLLILYSGGADSRLMLEFAKYLDYNPYCLLINYNQLHSNELDFAKKQLTNTKTSYQEVSISGLQIDSGLTGNGEKDRFGHGVNPWFVPGRNIMFASIALGVAENLGIKEIWFGADYSDLENGFLDCTQKFVDEVNKLYHISASFSIKFRAPLLGIDKNAIKSLFKLFNLNENEVFSGYGCLEEENPRQSKIEMTLT